MRAGGYIESAPWSYCLDPTYARRDAASDDWRASSWSRRSAHQAHHLQPRRRARAAGHDAAARRDHLGARRWRSGPAARMSAIAPMPAVRDVILLSRATRISRANRQLGRLSGVAVNPSDRTRSVRIRTAALVVAALHARRRPIWIARRRAKSAAEGHARLEAAAVADIQFRGCSPHFQGASE